MKWRNLPKNRKDFISKLQDKSPREILGVGQSASRAEIRKAYRELVLIYHPDRSHVFLKSHNEDILKIINFAYEKLLGEK